MNRPLDSVNLTIRYMSADSDESLIASLNCLATEFSAYGVRSMIGSGIGVVDVVRRDVTREQYRKELNECVAKARQTPYLVGKDDCWEVIHADNPDAALANFKHQSGAPQSGVIEVWSARESYPEVKLRDVFERQEEHSPEDCPLDEPWEDHLGTDVVDALQAKIDEVIRSSCKPFYHADKKLLTHEEASK